MVISGLPDPEPCVTSWLFLTYLVNRYIIRKTNHYFHLSFNPFFVNNLVLNMHQSIRIWHLQALSFKLTFHAAQEFYFFDYSILCPGLDHLIVVTIKKRGLWYGRDRKRDWLHRRILTSGISRSSVTRMRAKVPQSCSRLRISVFTNPVKQIFCNSQSCGFGTDTFNFRFRFSRSAPKYNIF